MYCINCLVFNIKKTKSIFNFSNVIREKMFLKVLQLDIEHFLLLVRIC